MTLQERLERANEVRMSRAALKRGVARRKGSAAAVIVGPPDFALGMRVHELLRAQWHWGDLKAERLLAYAGVEPLATLGELKPSQRDRLVKALRGRA